MAKKKKKANMNLGNSAENSEGKSGKSGSSEGKSGKSGNPVGKSSKSAEKASKSKKSAGKAKTELLKNSISDGYLANMNYAPRIDDHIHSLQLIPAALFAAVVIFLVHQYRYYRDMSDYYWSNSNGGTPTRPALVEFFSHDKVTLITICFVLALVVLLYRLITQAFFIKRTPLYIPMLVYLLFVFLSLAFSEVKDIAWMGWNERFEGTFILLCYMIMLFYIINSVNSERNIKWILYPLAGTSVILSLLGISQATNHDFFRTVLGQKLLLWPNNVLSDGTYPFDHVDELAAQGQQYLKFTFQNNEIYQTVYNINYVSFYLTLLIPVFGMLFIRENTLWKKICWGAIFTLVIFNLIGSASSGGLMGCFVMVVVAVVLLNKRLIQWWKSTAILVVLVLLTGLGAYGVAQHFGGTSWTAELIGAVHSVLGNGTKSQTPAQPAQAVEVVQKKHKIDYFITHENSLDFSIDGNAARLSAGELSVSNMLGELVDTSYNDATKRLTFNDPRFSDISFYLAQGEKGEQYIVFTITGEEYQWVFERTGENNDELLYRNDLGKLVSLENIPHLGFANNPSFGSGRGYIWSTTIPMLKDTLFIGHGADTYTLYYPHKDYVGKYNAGWNINMIVDKPHNMYLGIGINTGVLSLLALLALFGIYMVQSFRLYLRQRFSTFASYAGAGIFLGICGFLVSGIVNDSTVSIMPMFYALLGTGIATNIIVKRAAGNQRTTAQV